MNRVNTLIAMSLMLCACTTTEVTEQFIPSDQQVIVRGCEELKANVSEWNIEHPDQPRLADC